MMRRVLWVAVLWLIACSALADDAGGASKEEASAHFRQGVELFREGAYRAALVELQRAYEIAPDYRVLFNIGQTQLQLGEYVAAIKAFELYLVQGGAGVDAKRRDEVENDLASLRKRVATLAISVSEEGANVVVDGESVGKSPLAATVPVSVGRHRVFAQAEDGATASQVIDVAGGDFKEIELDLVKPKLEVAAATGATAGPNAPAPPRFTHRQRWGIGLASAGGALLVGSLVTGILAKNAHEDYGDALNKIPRDNSAVKSAKDDIQTYAILTDALLVSGAALAVTGTVLLLIKGGDKESAPKDGKVSVKVGVAPSWLGLQGRF